MTTTTTLYERLGGRDGLLKISGDFYDLVMADGDLAPIFHGTDLRRQQGMLAAWMGAKTGGPAYRGRGLREAHVHLHLTVSHFVAVAGHLSAALEKNSVSDEDRNAVMDAAAAEMDEVLNH